MPRSKVFDIRCWHKHSAPTSDLDCTTACVIHCDNQWRCKTLNQAKQIRNTHLAINESHVAKIYDEEGIEVELEEVI